jgi:hypothetical protein
MGMPIRSRCGYRESWIVYSTPHHSAKELTVFPGRSVSVQDAAGYIVVQGHGAFGVHDVETPTLIRYGQMTKDGLCVNADAAKRGVVFVKRSADEDLVLLKHVGPQNRTLP